MQFRRTCVALQIGFSLLLIVGAGLFVRTIHNLRNVDPGFATDHLLTFRLAPERAGYPANQVAPVEQRVARGACRVAWSARCGSHQRSRSRRRRTSTAMSRFLVIRQASLTKITTSSFPGSAIITCRRSVFRSSPDAISPLADSATATKVTIVNETFARHYFGSAQSALGHHVSPARGGRKRTR